jgi:succinate dehydrogenase / fumarate reductase, cytochrome b subunit
VNDPRPRNLNLLTIRFPLPAIISILHRLSGVFLFLMIPLSLWGLHFSLHEKGFATLQQWWHLGVVKIMVWLLLMPFVYHLIAGTRHLLLDLHLGETWQGGRRASQLTLVVFILFGVLTGIWLW